MRAPFNRVSVPWSGFRVFPFHTLGDLLQGSSDGSEGIEERRGLYSVGKRGLNAAQSIRSSVVARFEKKSEYHYTNQQRMISLSDESNNLFLSAETASNWFARNVFTLICL